MAGVTETNNWSPEVYRFEPEDVVEGGEDGLDNLPGKQLAGRTNWLRLMISAICAAEGVTVVNDETTQLLTALDSRIGNAISALVDSSPAALDTLNELAAALGDDPNFATTVTNALALKAPLASPALTGTPTAPTAEKGTNTNQLATTEFVTRAINETDTKQSCRVASTLNVNIASPGANIDGVAMAAGNRVLLKDQAAPVQNGLWIWNGAAVAMTRAPDADDGAELNSGAIVPVESGTLNADTLWMLTTDGVVTIGVTGLTFALTSGFAVASQAEVDAGSVSTKGITPLTLKNGFAISLTTNGYVKVPSWLGGWIIQWGTTSSISASSSQVITLPLAHPNACLNLSVTRRDTAAGSTANAFYGNINSSSQITVYNGTSTSLMGYWFTFGY